MSQSYPSIILVGPMGVGKTTIGKILASATGYQFIDSDQEIEGNTGVDIPWIFDQEGEDGFRKREQEILAELTNRQQLIIATGGGAVLSGLNRQHMQQRGFVVYLKAKLSTLVERTKICKNRPLLNCENPRKKMEELMNSRRPLYKSVANMEIDTDKYSHNTVVKRIQTAYENANSNHTN